MSSGKGLNDAEQYVLQQFLNNGVLDQFSFKDLFKGVLNKFQIKYDVNDNEELKKKMVVFLKSISEALKPYSLEIKNGTCEVTGTTFYCLVRLYDSIGTLSQLYSQSELKLFKKILNLIIESDDCTIQYGTIVSGISDEPELKFSHKDIREITDKFVRDYWLVSVGGKFSLHTRTILELSEYLKEIYGADVIVGCKLCKDIVVCGFVCESCNVKIHRHCARRYFKATKDCPACKNPFPDDIVTVNRNELNTSNSRQNSTAQQQPTQDQALTRDIKNITLLNEPTRKKKH